MNPKTEDRKKAIMLRRRGLTYSEVLKQVPVAKSTLSLWLREVGLAKQQAQKLTEKKRLAQLRGGAARKKQRIDSTTFLKEKARKEIGMFTNRELWLVGVALYWAEGSKERGRHSNGGVDFANTDPLMIKLFLRWLTESCGIPMSSIYAHLYIHTYQKRQVPEALKFWSSSVGIPQKMITGVYFKRHNPKTNRKNAGDKYYGTLRLRVKRSTSLLRTIHGWIDGCAENWGVV